MSSRKRKGYQMQEPSGPPTDRLGRFGLVFARLVIGVLWITQLAWKIAPQLRLSG